MDTMWGVVAGIVGYLIALSLSRRFMDYIGLESGFVRLIALFIISVSVACLVGYWTSWTIGTPKQRIENAKFVSHTYTDLSDVASCVTHSDGKPCEKISTAYSQWSNHILYGVDK